MPIRGTSARSPSDLLILPEDRLFDPVPDVRRVAREIYHAIRDLPIISPHGHVDPRILAEDAAFPEPAALIVQPDHYVLRMLYSQGVPLERLGVPTRDGTPVETDSRAVWRLFAERFHLFRGTPTGLWLKYELHVVLGVGVELSGETADRVYDEIVERLASPEFRPRALFDRFGIEVLATTDAATDTLEHHRAIQTSDWDGRVIPTFRPDAAFALAAPGWRNVVARLSELSGMSVRSASELVAALRDRRVYFQTVGARATDHGVELPHARRLRPDEADALFTAGMEGRATAEHQRRFEAHMLMEMAGLSAEDGLVMQLHAGSLRNHNREVFDRFGPDTGGDIPVATEWTRNLRELLNAYGNDPRFRLILFTLDESTYSRELAPLAGHWPAVRLGPPWWFHDSVEGMNRFRERTTETAGIHNTAGFNDDTRAFCSIPARHDLARRVDANWLARLVTRHVVDLSEAHEMARALTYDLARETYRLDGAGDDGVDTEGPWS